MRALAAGGAGVADLPDGRVVFVPRTAPGDRARIRVERAKARWATGTLEQLIEPGPRRRDPLCALYDRCGGCALQHIPEAEQRLWKGRFVADALQRIGGITLDEVPEVVPSPAATGYRNRVTFTLRRLGGRVVAGFHALGRPAHVLDVAGECVLPEPELTRVWSQLRRGWGPGASALPAGGRLRLTLRNTTSGVVLVVEGGEGPWDAQVLARAVPSLTSIWHRSGEGPGALCSGSLASDRWGDDFHPVGGMAFVQVNRFGAALLSEHVLGQVPETPARAVDAYCGAGAFGRALARRGWRVTGVELEPTACAAARNEPPEGFDLIEGRVEDHLDRLLPTDLLILNPPRSGLTPGLPQRIAAAPPARMIYVSCDPGTLARDLAALQGRMILEGVRCFDLFPQTAHVETVASFRMSP